MPNPTVVMIEKIGREIFERIYHGASSFEKDNKTIRHYIQISEEMQEYMLNARMWLLLGTLYLHHGRMEEGKDYTLKAYWIYRKQGAVNRVIITLNNLAVIYNALQDAEKVIFYCQKGYRLRTHPNFDATDHISLSFCMGNLATGYFMAGDMERACDMAQECLQFIGENTQGAITPFAASNIVLAEVHLQKGMFEQAWQQTKLAVDFALGAKNYHVVANTIFTQAHIAALDSQSENSSEYYYQKGRDCLQKETLRIVQGRVFMREAMYQIQHNHPEKAIGWLTEAKQIFNEINAETEATNAARLLAAYEIS